MYTFGSAGLSSTEYANRTALEHWRLVPRMLRDATTRNLDVSLVACPVLDAILRMPADDNIRRETPFTGLHRACRSAGNLA